MISLPYILPEYDKKRLIQILSRFRRIYYSPSRLHHISHWSDYKPRIFIIIFIMVIFLLFDGGGGGRLCHGHNGQSRLGIKPPNNTMLLGPKSLHPEQNLHLFSHFGTAKSHDRLRHSCIIDCNSLHLMHSMWSKITQYQYGATNGTRNSP